MTIHWHASRARLDIYKNGELVAQIPAQYYLNLVQDLVNNLVSHGFAVTTSENPNDPPVL